jgi:hypothetical protein
MDKGESKDSKHNATADAAGSENGVNDSCPTPNVSDKALILPDAPRQNNQGENIMAEIVTGTTTGFMNTETLQRDHADIRKEGVENTAAVRLAVMQEGQDNMAATKDARHDIITEVDRQGDRVTDLSTAYYIAGQQNATDAARDIASLKTLTDANAQRMSVEMALGIEKSAAASALAAEKIGSAVALGQSILSKEIFHDGQRTRDLINDLKYHDLNRALVERNTELVDERHGRRHYSRLADQSQFQGQWAALQSQIQAFQSQLQTATQGTVNFGTMSGNAGRNQSTNNVA